MRKVIHAIASFKETALIVVIISLAIAMAIISPHFASRTNLESILLGLSVEGIITIGMVILLISGGLDLSIGSTLAFSGVVTGLMLNSGVPVALSVFIGLLAAGAIGCVNGVLIAKLSLNPFIITLGMAMAVRGLTLVVADGRAILNLPETFTPLGQGKLLGIQYPIYIVLALALLGDYMLRNMRFVRQSYYIGGNEAAAKLNGINIERVKIFNYVLVAVLAGFAGILVAARFGSASVTVGQGMEMNVLTATIIGGASLAGGVGSVFGGLLGALFILVISNSLNLIGVDSYWQNFVTGSILVISVLLNTLEEKRRTNSLMIRRK